MKFLGRYSALFICFLGLLLLGIRGSSQPEDRRPNKLIIYPAPGETVEQLKQRGLKKVRDYGSYWVAEANDEQVQSLRATHGGRAVKADHLNRLELNAASVDTTVGEPAIPAYLREIAPGPKRLRLVQFVGPMLPEWLELVKSAGKVRIVSYVPNNAYLVWLEQGAEENLRQIIEPAGPIQWIGPYHPYYKIQKNLVPSDPKKQVGTVDVRVAVLDGPNAEQTLWGVERFALTGLSQPLDQLGQKIVQMTARVADVAQIAQIPDVVWIERQVPRELKDEKQDLLLASRTNQVPGHAPIPANAGGERYLDFLFDKVGGGLPSFTNPATYPIVDIADTGLEIGSTAPAHPDFYEFGDKTRGSRVAYATAALGCPRFSPAFNSGSDFCGHGTFVASIVSGYSDRTNETVQCTESFEICECVTTPFTNCFVTVQSITRDNTLVRLDAEEFQRGLGVSPFGLIGSTRIFSQSLTLLDCEPFRVRINDCQFCAFSLPVLVAEQYLNRGRIANNSWGDILVVDQDGNFLNAGAYTSDSQSYDIAVRDALLTGGGGPIPGPSPLNQELIAVFAGGNAGSVGNVGGFGDILVTAPATAKNIIAVGATENVRLLDGCLIPGQRDNSLDISDFSSFGPTLDGRFKPDIVAPGSSIFGANNLIDFERVIDECELTRSGPRATECHVEQGVQECGSLYTCSAGTSFSAPAVSGGVQLLWWYFQNRLRMLQPSPAMAKAYLLNSARYLPFMNPLTGTMDSLPSIAQGMGMMDLDRMFDGVPRALRDQSTPRAIDVSLLVTNVVSQQTYFNRTGQSYEMQGQIFDATKPFRATVAWTDAPGDPAVNGRLVNNLDLEVSIGGRTYRGNVFSGGNSLVDPLRNPDNVNNVESVFLPPGQTGTWTVVVRATNIAGDGVPNVGTSLDQDFALVVYNVSNPNDVANVNTNDCCQQAETISSFPFSTTRNFSPSVYHNCHPSPSAARGGIDAFWKIARPIQGTTITADTFGSSFDTVLSVWRGECGALVEETSNNNASNTLQSAVSFTADGTNSYFIVVDKRAGSTSTMVLNVSAVLPPINLTPSTLNFGSLLLGASSAPRTATYVNGSVSPVAVESVVIEGSDAASFTIFDEDCGGSIVPSKGTCAISIVFSPSRPGTNTAQLIVSDNALGSPRVVELTGIGLPAAPVECFSANKLEFGSVTVGFSSSPKSLIVTNCGTTNMVITGFTLSGANSGEFAVVSTTCTNNPIAPNGTCSVDVTFTPGATGGRSAKMSINSNATNTLDTITLGGTGIPPAPLVCLSTTGLAFGGQEVGTTSSPPQSVTVTNCGTANLVISSVAITGGGARDFSIASTTCNNATIVPNGTCVINVVFNPTLTNVGPRNATLTISDNAAGSPHTAALSGSATGSQPDVSISKSRRLKRFVGRGVLTPPSNVGLQTLTQKVRRGKTKIFYIAFENIGVDVDSFQVLGGGDSPGNFTVKYFVGAFDFNGIANDVTSAVRSGEFSTSSLASGAITGDATLLRVEVTADAQAAGGTSDIVIATRSTFDPSKRDEVRARIIVR